MVPWVGCCCPLELCDVFVAGAGVGRFPTAAGFLIGFFLDEVLKMLTAGRLRTMGATGPPAVGVTELGPDGGCAGELLIVVVCGGVGVKVCEERQGEVGM